MGCRMQVHVCICAQIQRAVAELAVTTRLVLIMHHREYKKVTNTGALAARLLPDSEIRLRGLRDRPFDGAGLVAPERQTLLLYPSRDALPLTAERVRRDGRPVTLVVPDGNWRQAGRVARRVSELAAVPRVRLVEGEPSRYRLRAEHRRDGLATIEAIARALGVIEGDAAQRAVERVFDALVEAVLKTRGRT